MKARLSYAHPGTNLGKLRALDALQAKFRAHTQACIDQMVSAKRHHISIGERQTFFTSNTALSSHLRKSARAQAVHVVSTWHAALWSRLKKRLYQEKHEPIFRTQIRLVALYGLREPKKCGHIEVTQEAVDLWWSWVWNPEVAGKTPVLKDDAPMWLAEGTIEFEPPRSFGRFKSTPAKMAVRWARVSCLVNGKRVCIPLVCDPKTLTASNLSKSVLVGKRDGRWFFQVTDQSPEPGIPTPPFDSKKVAVDVGKNVLAATSDGQILDRKSSKKFDEVWNRFHRHHRNRQRLGKHLEKLGRVEEARNLLQHSDRLRRKERSMTGLIKTAAGTVARKLVARHPEGTTFVLEDLDLQGCKGRKRFAYRAVQKAIESRSPVEKVHAAYSSQTCRKCGYVNPKNRTGTKFLCLGCGFKSHADVNASVNLLGRSGDKQVTIEVHFRSVGVIVRDRYRRRRSRSGRLANWVPTVAPAGQCDARGSYSGELDPLVGHASD